MRIETAVSILEFFPGSKWANKSSVKHEDAAKLLAGFSHEDIIQACKTMRASLARNQVDPEEIVGEIHRNRRKASALVKQWDGVNPHEIDEDRKFMRNAILLAPAEIVRKAVAECRKNGVLGPQPLPPNREQWTSYAIGMVYAVLERMENQ